MTSDPDRRVTIYARGSLTVWAYFTDDGDLHIEGQDLDRSLPGGECEYFLTVPADQVAALTSALGVASGSFLDHLVEHGESIVKAGERAWLNSLGVEPVFASWG